MQISFESPCKLVKVGYYLTFEEEVVEIASIQAFTRPTRRHGYKIRYKGTTCFREFNDISYLPQTEKKLLAELPFNENGPTPEIKAKILEALKKQLTIV